MQRNFEAEINIKVSNTSKKLVSIIPFYDRDKRIAKNLEDVLNHYLICEEEYDLDRDDYFRRLTAEMR